MVKERKVSFTFSAGSVSTLIYNLFAKVLAERLKKVMPSITDPLQCGFLEERQILDPILIANKTVEDCRIRKKKRWIFKLDLEKVFN